MSGVEVDDGGWGGHDLDTVDMGEFEVFWRIDGFVVAARNLYLCSSGREAARELEVAMKQEGLTRL